MFPITRRKNQVQAKSKEAGGMEQRAQGKKQSGNDPAVAQEQPGARKVVISCLPLELL
jgi:hypothetical protein